MKEVKGIVRKIEGLGRLVIPKAVREHLGVDEKDRVEFLFGADEEVILRRYKERCVFCGAEKQLIEYKDQVICENCLAELKKSY